MSTIAITKSSTQNTRSFITRWLAMANGDAGAAMTESQYSDRTVQIAGTFGTGGTVVIEGSNDDGVTWATLTDVQGNALSFTSAGIKAVTEVTQQMRPRVTAGDGTTSVNVHLFGKEV